MSHRAILESNVEAGIAALASLRTVAADFSAATDAMVAALRPGMKILACGNGGSAADAAHFMTELLCRFKDDRPSLPGVALTNDGSFLTAAANDYGFDHVFSRQVEGLGRAGDVLVGISTSGNSGNVNTAPRVAREKGLVTVSLLGRDGGAANGLADIEIIVPSDITARIQEAHQVLIHAFCEAIEKQLFD